MRQPKLFDPFRYLHEGKLYLIEPGSAIAKRNSSSRSLGESRRPEYAWLCPSCCRHLTIRFDEEFGATVVRKTEALQDKEFGFTDKSPRSHPSAASDQARRERSWTKYLSDTIV
jgi:hypothetical protein